MRAAALVLLVACHAAIPELPSKGGPAWTEVTSEHFVLWTDAGTKPANELIRQMEFLHQVIFGVAFPGKSDVGRSFVIGVRDTFEIHAYLPDQFGAMTMGGTSLRIPTILLPMDTDERDGHVVTHELSHLISHVAIHDQPPWFAEGLAEFFETVRLDPDKAQVDVGEPLTNQVASVRRYPLVPGPQLFACKAMGCRDSAFYATSALTFSYLANTHPDQLVMLEDELAKDNPRAWDVTGIAPGDLDRLVRTWVLQGQHRVWHFTAKLKIPQTASRTLTDQDVIALRAFLDDAFHGKREPALTALKADPTNVMLRLVAQQPGTPEEARATVAAHPEDWRAYLLLLEAIKVHDDEAKAARAKLCELVAANPAAELSRSFCPLDRVPAGPEGGQQPPVTQ
ncbi:MAG: hypothetical protein QM831_28225 [Kofleriaceae bacterium]